MNKNKTIKCTFGKRFSQKDQEVCFGTIFHPFNIIIKLAAGCVVLCYIVQTCKYLQIIRKYKIFLIDKSYNLYVYNKSSLKNNNNDDVSTCFSIKR